MEINGNHKLRNPTMTLKSKVARNAIGINAKKVDAQTANELGWFTAIVKRPFRATWRNYGVPEIMTDYKAGERIRCEAWKPEGMSPCKASGHPDMWLSWKSLDNCEFAPEDIARLQKLRAQNACKNALGTTGISDDQLKDRLNKMLKHEAISIAGGGNPKEKGAIQFLYRGRQYYVPYSSEHMVKMFEEAGLIKRIKNACTSTNGVPAGTTALRIAYDVDGRPIKVGDKVTATAGASFKEDVIASIFKDGVKGIFVTLKSSPLVRRDPSAEIMKNSCALKSKVARNAVAACNDKWIDDFHVIVTAEKPDPALVDALKKKAAAWKAYKRNFSDKAADEAHEKAKHDVATVAKRLGAKLEQLGAVLRVIMPNTATNAKDANGVEIKIGSLVRPKSMRPGMEEVVKRIDGNKV